MIMTRKNMYKSKLENDSYKEKPLCLVSLSSIYIYIKLFVKRPDL